jgi:hypothetical protein
MKIGGSRTSRLQAVVLATTVCVSGVPRADAGQGSGPAAPKGEPVVAAIGERASIAGPATASIVGSAWNADGSPIPRSRVRLRNVTTGLIQAATTADEEGRFAFADAPAGTYVVELVSDTGKILTVGHRFLLSPGESVVTFVRLSSEAPWFNGFFSNAALAVAAAAAATGLTALAPEQVRPVSGRQ